MKSQCSMVLSHRSAVPFAPAESTARSREQTTAARKWLSGLLGGLLLWFSIHAFADVQTDAASASLAKADTLRNINYDQFAALLESIAKQKDSLSQQEREYLQYLQAWKAGYDGDQQTSLARLTTLIDSSKGQIGRPSRSFTLAESLALLESARESRLNAYVVLSLATGIRTEEARELHWEHVYLDGDPGAARPVPPYVAVWHSVREGGDTKTARSRGTPALPQAAVQALREHRKRQTEDRLAAGSLWQDHGLVFASTIGTPLDAANVRREFRKITAAAGLGADWAPRDLRHTFVSLMSADGVPIEEIARLAATTAPPRQNSSTATSFVLSLPRAPR